jgi:microcystin-dependent protein
MRTMLMKTLLALALVALLGRPAAAQPDPFLGEIRLVGFTFAPNGWALCDGQLLSISQNAALFSLLGTTYGGNGVTNFALPDLRGRVAIHSGTGAGLTPRDLGSGGGSSSSSTVNLVGKQRDYGASEVETLAGPNGRAVAAGGVADDNMPPFLTINYIIALQGIYPSQ